MHDLVQFDHGQKRIENHNSDVWLKACGWNGDSAMLPRQDCTITIIGETRFLCIESCNSLCICIDNVEMGVLMRDCSNVMLVLGGEFGVPSITMLGCIGVEVITGPSPMQHSIETVGCCGCSLSVVQGVLPDASALQLMGKKRLAPKAIPERMMTTFQHRSMVTVAISSDRRRENAAVADMATNENIVRLSPASS